MRHRYRCTYPLVVLLLAVAAFLPRAAGAQQRPALDATTRAAVVQEVADQLRANYVFEDIAARYADALEQSLAAGRYDDITDPQRLADHLTTQLLEISPDGHLRIVTGDRLAGGRRVQVARDESPEDAEEEDEGPIQPDPRELRLEDLPADMRAMLESRLAVERRLNHYFKAVEVLPGNIGYLDFDQFGFLPEARHTADAAMTFLRGVDAFILDLRGNPGGIEGMNQYLASYFFGDDPVHLYSRFIRAAGESTYWSWPEEPVVHFEKIPLFVLVDNATGSSAENLSFALQGLGRATLVGAATTGGAHSSTPVLLPGGLAMILPIARAYNPRTGQDWEGDGVQPDVEAPSADALRVAHDLAIGALGERAENDLERAELDQARRQFALEQGITPEVDADLADYVGTYGNRRVVLDEGRLRLERIDASGQPKLFMVATADDEFTLERVPTALIQFERDGGGTVTGIRVRLPDGSWDTAARASDG